MKKKPNSKNLFWEFKFDLKMRISLLLFFVAVFAIQANDAYSQKTKISLNVEDYSVQQIIDKIEAVSEFKFVYETSAVDLSRKLSLKANGQKIERILKRVFSETSTSYKIRDRKIILVKKEPKKVIGFTDYSPIIQQQLTGTVTDADGQPLPGASVVEKGTSNGTQTDFDGNFSIQVSDENAILIISYIGYTAKEIEVNDQSIITISLQEDTAALDEVVVVGYGTQKREDVTGSYSTIKSDEIAQRPIASVEQALQGVVPGLQIAQTNGSPGQLGEIYIRGIKNLSTGTNPLFVIDGFTTEDQRIFQALNPADIASVDILKDASATAIYGSRGANGVIIVTTKTGKQGEPRFNVTVTGGVATVPGFNRPEILNAQEYHTFYQESYTNRGLDFAAQAPQSLTDWDGVTDTDWVDEVLRTGVYQNYAISASGANEKSDYLMSLNYLDQEGTVIGQGFEKFSARLKTGFRPTKGIELGLTLAPNYNIISNSGSQESLFADASVLPPTAKVRDENGEFTNQDDLNGRLNPLEVALNDKRTEKRFRLVTQLHTSIEFFEGLTFRPSIGVTFGSDVFESFIKPSGLNRGRSDLFESNEERRTLIDWQNENTLTYKKVVGDHSFDVVGGYTLQKTEIEGSNVGGRDFVVDGPRTLGFSDPDRLITENFKTATSLESWLGRVNYAYKDRYLLTASIRRDGSSRFGSNNRYATFKSGAIGWKLSEEPFMEKVGWINNAKIRASYGESGNNLINNFEWRANLTSDDANTVIGANLQGGVINQNPGNTDLTWETSEQVNVGFDLAVMDYKLNMTFDYFKNETSGLLLKRPLLPSTSFADVTQNAGSMDSWGYELTVNATVVDSEDFDLNVGGNVTYNDNEITDLGEGVSALQNFWGVFEHQIGEEVDQIRATEIIGVARAGDGSGLTPGSPIWNDISGDGTISNFLGDDSQNFGSPTVHWLYGFNINARYKDFELTTLFQGQAGALVQDFNITQTSNGANNNNVLKQVHFDGRYIDENNQGNGRVPFAGFHGLPGSPASVSSFGVQKTDFLRIRNITLNYHIPSMLLEKWGLNGMALFASVENLYTFTNFNGGNPEYKRPQGGPFGGARITGGNQFGLLSVGSVPLPTTVTLGLNLSL